MRIGINCLRIWPNYKGGVNSFTFGLIDAFARVGGQHSFVIFVNSQNREMFAGYEDLPNFRVIEVQESKYLVLRRLYESLPLTLRYNAALAGVLNSVLEASSEKVLEGESDICFVPYCPPALFPLPNVPTVYSIHDIQQYHYPDFFSKEQLFERAFTFPRCVAHATMVQASSQYMREDFLAHFPSLNESRVCVIPEGVDIGLFSAPRSGVNIRAKYNLPESFLFFPAQLWHHKNHITVLRALKRLAERHIKISLVLTGARYEASKEVFDFIEQNGLNGLVRYLGIVPFEDVVLLYKEARFLVTAVLYESSSIPILEAAAAGTPIIASETPPNIELAQRLKMSLFPPTNDLVLAEILEKVWNDAALIDAHTIANSEAIQYYSWDNAVRRYLEVFSSISSQAGM